MEKQINISIDFDYKGSIIYLESLILYFLKYITDMNKKAIFSILPILLFSLLLSCQGEKQSNSEEGVSADLVSNPISAEESKEKSKLPVMEFKTTSHDFGAMVQGEKVAHKFTFKNTGGADLIISNASATCGCTIPSYSRKPIKPGDEGEIEVVFDSAGKTGSQHKSINILTNAQPNKVRLDIDAEVIVMK